MPSPKGAKAPKSVPEKEDDPGETDIGPYEEIWDSPASSCVAQCTEGIITICWTWSIKGVKPSHFSLIFSYEYITVGSGQMTIYPHARGVSLTPAWTFPSKSDFPGKFKEAGFTEFEKESTNLLTPSLSSLSTFEGQVRDLLLKGVNAIIPQVRGLLAVRSGVVDIWLRDHRAKALMQVYIASLKVQDLEGGEQSRAPWQARLSENCFSPRDVMNAAGRSTFLGVWAAAVLPCTLPAVGFADDALNLEAKSPQGVAITNALAGKEGGAVHPVLEPVLKQVYQTYGLKPRASLLVWWMTILSVLGCGSPDHVLFEELSTPGLMRMAYLLFERRAKLNKRIAKGADRDLVQIYTGTRGPKAKDVRWADIGISPSPAKRKRTPLDLLPS
jgi:hypothetical protein